MKSKAALFWFFVSVLLAVTLALQWNAGRKQRLILEKVQLQVEQAIQAKKMATSEVEELQKERLKLSGDLQVAEFELSQARALNATLQATNAPAAARAQSPAAGQQQGRVGAANMGEMLGNMLKDPEMRKALEHQQRMGMEMIYGSLFEQLGLSPEQEKKFREILLEQQMSSISQAGEMFGANTNRAEVARKMRDQQKQREEQFKEVLGSENYERFQNYNQTLGERMMIEQFGRQAEISADQREQLLGIIQEEKKNIQVNRNIPAFDPNRDWQKVMESGEAVDQMLSTQEAVNSRVLDRASTVLSPEQVQKLGPLLQSQLEMQKASMKMARQMLGDQNNPELGPPPVPVPNQ